MQKKKDVNTFLKTHLVSRCPFLYVISWEEDRVIQRVKEISSGHFDRNYIWSITSGFKSMGEEALKLDDKNSGPYACLDFIAANQKRSLFILLDYHPYISESKITRKLRELINNLQANGSCVIFLSPQLNLPMELEKDVAVLDFPLPNITDVKELYKTIDSGVKDNARLKINLNKGDTETLLDATLGLTENEIKNIFAKALVSDASLDISDLDIVLSEKEQIVRKSGILEYYSAVENFDHIGGLETLKLWLKTRNNAFSKEARDFGLSYPKGLLLIGVPGCGKSLAAKATANQWNQPLLRLDVGKVFGNFVGSSEENIRRAIQFAEAIAPAILWIDEIEKGFSGTKSLGDSGTAARVFSTFLTWMQEKTSSVFVVATANDISGLPPEMLRKGRFDEIFFVDLPYQDEREEILKIHLKRRNRDYNVLKIDIPSLAKELDGFSGAEIEQLITDALYKAFYQKVEISTALLRASFKETYPLSEVMKEPIQAMRDWARNRARFSSSQWRDNDGKVKRIERWANLDSLSNEQT